MMRSKPCWKVLIVTAIMAAGGEAQAQNGGARYDGEVAAGVFQRIDPGSRWGRGLELSEGGRAQSNTTATSENFVINRDTFGLPGQGTIFDHQMTLGFRGIWPAGSALTATEPDLSSSKDDDEKITYYTMRYDGIQLGFSYSSVLERGADHLTYLAAPTKHDVIALGANYDRRFDEFGVGVSAGYLSANAFDDLETPGTETFTLGARFDMGGLRVSGGFQKGNELRENANQLASSDGDKVWNLGARYRWGRNDVGFTYAYGENRAVLNAPGEDTFDAATLSYVRKLDRGVKWSVNLIWADHGGESTSGADDNEGAALGTMIRLSF